jgi:mono/diheme cytochrome c family protein
MRGGEVEPAGAIHPHGGFMEARKLVAILLVASSASAAAIGCKSGVPPASVTEGQRAYFAHCAICHGDQGSGDGPFAVRAAEHGSPPPRLDDATRLAALGREGVARSILSGAAHLRGASGMPMWGAYLDQAMAGRISEYVIALPDLPAPAREAAAAYVRSPEGVPEDGRRLYVHNCSGCHGPYGAGDAVLPDRMRRQVAAPALADSARFANRSDADLKDILALGGAHAPKAPTMPGWINALTDEQRVGLVAYLRVLSRTRSR